MMSILIINDILHYSGDMIPDLCRQIVVSVLLHISQAGIFGQVKVINYMYRLIVEV